MKNIFYNKFIQVIFVSLLLFVFSYRILGSFYFHNLNGEFLYFLKDRIGINRANVNPNIVVVQIDDFTLNKLGFPLDRKDYITFLDSIKSASPAVIGFDVLFLDKGKDNLVDTKLANKFNELGNIILGSDIDIIEKIGSYILVKPYDLFFKSIKDTGYFTPIIDSQTNKVYSIKPYDKLFYKGKADYFESFSFSVLREYFNYIYGKTDKLSIKDTNKTKIYNFYEKKIPIYNGKFYINYNESSKFQSESFYNIYSGKFDKNKLKDKIVLVGFTAEGVKDDFFVPGIGQNSFVKGVYIHANIINNILNDEYVIFFNKYFELLIAYLFIFLIIYVNIIYLKNTNLRWITIGAISLFLIIIVLYFCIFYLSYKNSLIFLLPNYPFEFFSVLFFSFFVSSILKYVNEDKNKRLLSKALSEYVSSDIAKEILYSRGDVKLTGENKCITIFFSDISGFTTISEKLSPEELVSFLSLYLGEMSNIILDNKGFINKYEGDAIMALWGVFGKVEDFGVIQACKSALLQQIKLKSLNEKWKNEGKNELQVRMGLHTGNAIIGNIGASGRKMEFTALGDNVNLGSRLEGVNKFYGTNICVSKQVYELTKKYFTFRYLDKIKVKGKNIGIEIYELISNIGEQSDLKQDIINKFEEAIKYYVNRQFNEALKIFSYLDELGDNPSKTYKKRCEMYLINSPSEDWDGVWVLDEK
ncbi:MAG: adenylate/guanylate cyclase domain-containing protein [Candidatus Gracilibacteria bacterium]|nr:adenylate/guanylate cyclase domain-containing protein [Candidatus Gracilibacteria bacterium]